MATTPTELVDQIDGKELKAKYSDQAKYDKNNKQIDSFYCSKSDAEKYGRYAGGTGIVITGSGVNSKTVSSNFVELPLHSGTGIKAEMDANQEYAIIRALPEVLLYRSTSPTMSGTTTIVPDISGGTSTQWNNLGNDGTLVMDNDGISGLNTDVLYHCSAKFKVSNVSGSAAAVTINASVSFVSGSGESVYGVFSDGDTLVTMDWYVKGATTITFTATGLSSGSVTAGLAEFSACEVCDA